MSARITYTNSAGQAYDMSIGDTLLRLFLHGPYHRGKSNVLLRKAGAAAVGVDYLLWQREQRR